MASSRAQRLNSDHNRRTRIRLQLENYRLREERRRLMQMMASPLSCISCNGPTVPLDLAPQENEQRFENALLRAELETVTSFKRKLNSMRERFPAATDPSLMAVLSLKEVISLARIGTPMWTNGRLDLNRYYSTYFPWYAKNVPGFIHEASRDSGLVQRDALSLVNDLMNPVHWKEIFPAIVADVSVEEFPHPRYQVINVHFMPQISPIVQTRNVKMVRCSKFIDNDTWVIADISMFCSAYDQHLRPDFLRFPSGYLIQRITNGVSKVTVLDHWVYREEKAKNLLINQYLASGAQQWLTDLKRHYYNTCVLTVPSTDHHIQSSENSVYDPIYLTNLLNLSTVMVNQFCTGVCATTEQKWKRLKTIKSPIIFIGISSRDSQDMNGVPGVLVGATGLGRVRAKPDAIFGIINGTKQQDIWNYLQPVGDIKKVITIKRSHDLGNEVSVFKFGDWYMIQETYYRAPEAMIIHSCIQGSYYMAAITGGDFSGIDLLPCGFTIVPYGELGSIVSCGYQVMAGQATMVTSPRNMVKYLQKMVIDTIKNVLNVLLPR